MMTRSRWTWHEGLAVLLLIVSASLAWSKRIGGGDTFVSLAAGRDAIAGKMGLPDDWSFTTEGRVWLDQNWGSHTAYYVSWRLFGDAGPVAVKWIVLFGVVLLMVYGAWLRGANWLLAATLVAVTILVGRTYLDVRPHIFTLLFEAAMIVIFFRWYRGSAMWAFVAAFIIGLWSNMHGGFVFGIAVMGLWGMVQAFFKILWPESRPWGWNHLFSYAGALVLAVLLATFLNPFGPVNLTHPLVVEKSPIWLSVQEWHPILDMKALFENFEFKQAKGFGSVTEFLYLMVVLAATVLCWLVMRLLPTPKSEAGQRAAEAKPSRREGKRKKGKAEPKPSRLDPNDWIFVSGLFDVIFAGVIIAMAFKARRFIPLATVGVVPIMAVMLTDVFARFGRGLAVSDQEPSPATRISRWVLSGINGVLLIVGCYFVWTEILLVYANPNPYYPKQSVLMRMVGSQTFPQKAVSFLLEQPDIPNHAFVDWRWEGYSRWRTDRFKTFCGGRAQQVHSEEIATWQITTPSQGAKPLRIVKTRRDLAIANGPITVVLGRPGGNVLEIGAGRTPLARAVAGVAVNEAGQLSAHTSNKTVAVNVLEETSEYWAYVQVIVERTEEPTFRAEYTVTVLADQPWMSHNMGWCTVQLDKLTNTGSKPLDVANHMLVMRSLQESSPPAGSELPVVFWQTKDDRYGWATVNPADGMGVHVQPNAKPATAVSYGRVGKTIQPGETFEPQAATSVAFRHHVPPNFPPKNSLGLLRHLKQKKNPLILLDEADEHDIGMFLLPRNPHAIGLALLLMGSKRWALVYDDATAFVVVNRRDPDGEKLIQRIMKGEASYPSAYLKGLGEALTRRSMAPTNAPIEPFIEDLKSAAKLAEGPALSALWWLSQLPVMYPEAGRPDALAKNIPFWLEQWEQIGEIDPESQYAIRAYQAKQIIAQMLRNTYGRQKNKEKANEWQARGQELMNEVKQLREKYM